MFEVIKQTAGRVLLLVPDQFTLQAEKEAFYYLEAKGLMELEVLSFSRLGARVLAETGGGGRARIDECGRYMLLTKLAASPIFWPSLTGSPAFTRGCAGAPACCDKGMVAIFGAGKRRSGRCSHCSLFSGGCSPP